jgi:hypothetical protein
MMLRRNFLQQSVAAASAMITPRVGFALAPNREDLRERAARIIREYDEQGIHRTGTRVDQLSARWLARLARECGVTPQLETFILSRIDPLACYLQIGKRRIEGLPIFDGGFTEGVTGKIGPLNSDAEIGLIEAPPNAEYTSSYEKTRRETRHRAIVIVTRGARAGLTPINAPQFTSAYGPPALQVTSEENDWLKQQAEKKSEATLIARVSRTKARAFNVTARIKGADAKLAPLVVMTPRSGWWRCASERGGGLVCWLEVMRALAAARPARSCLFVASSGHELGHLGLDHFIDQRRTLVKDAHAWIHLGANIGARNQPGHRLQTSSGDLDKLAIEAMKAEGARVDEVRPRDAAPLGEAGNIHRGGGRYISVVGRNGLFHHSDDRWPQAVDADAVAAFAGAFVRIALAMAKG